MIESFKDIAAKVVSKMINIARRVKGLAFNTDAR